MHIYIHMYTCVFLLVHLKDTIVIEMGYASNKNLYGRTQLSELTISKLIIMDSGGSWTTANLLLPSSRIYSDTIGLQVASNPIHTDKQPANC